MNIFRLFSKNKTDNDTLENTIENVDSIAEDNVDETIENKAESPKTDVISISYGTGLPIDIIYGYMRKNYSEQGFQDAIATPDITFKDINKQIIKNKILVVFQQIKLKYEVMTTEIEQRINSCRNVGLIDTIFQLQHDKDILSHHITEINSLEAKFRNGDFEATSCLQTYEAGFLKGLAATAIGSTEAIMKGINESNNN